MEDGTMNQNEYREVIGKFMHAGRHHKKTMDGQIRQTGVYESQHRTLMSLAEHKEYTQKELAELMHISPASLAVTLKKLEKGNYITRQMDHADNRCNKLVLTDAGQKIVATSRVLFAQIDAEALAGFSEAELNQFCSYLDRFCANLDRVDERNIVGELERSKKI
jgi:DNA-binding MarR family transcriptional regulator